MDRPDDEPELDDDWPETEDDLPEPLGAELADVAGLGDPCDETDVDVADETGTIDEIGTIGGPRLAVTEEADELLADDWPG